MHIAFFSPSWPPAGVANGVVTYVDAMREELLRRGHEVSVVTLNTIFEGDSEKGRPSPTGRFDQWWYRLDLLRNDTSLAVAEAKRAFADLHRRHPIDIIEMEETFGWFEGVAKLGIPLVVRLHGPCFRCPEWTDPAQRDRRVLNRERRERRGLEATRAITSPARSTLEDTAAFYKLSAPFQEVIVNPVSIAAEPWSAAGCDPNRLLFVGQFSNRKGGDLLVRAFDQVADEFPDLRLDMVGPDTGIGIDGENVRFEDFCSRFIRPETRARIQWHGLLKPEQIKPLRKRAGLTLVTSRSEVFPYIVAEAFAAGSPVLSTQWGGEREMIRHGESGWITQENTPEAVAAELRDILSAPMSAREVCSQGGLAFCKANLSQAAVVEKVLPLYQAVIEAKGA